MLGNIQKLARKKSREIQPRKKGLRNFSSKRIGLNKAVDTYAT